MKLTDEQIINLAKQVTGWTVHFAIPQEPLGHFYAGPHHQASVDNIVRFARALLAQSGHSGDGGEKACAHPSWKHIGNGQDQCELCGAIGMELRYLSVNGSPAPAQAALASKAAPVPQYGGDERISTKALREHANKGWGDDCLLPRGSVKRIADELDALRAALASNKAAAVAARPADDVLWDKTLTERDNYHEWADKLASSIAEHFGIEIGEHSNLNNPWAIALDTLESMPVAAAVAVGEPIKSLYGPNTHVCWTPDHTPKEDRVQVVLISKVDFDRANAALSPPAPIASAEEAEPSGSLRLRNMTLEEAARRVESQFGLGTVAADIRSMKFERSSREDLSSADDYGDLPEEAVYMTDEEIDIIAESMPGGIDGFLKGWGWRNFARAIEAEVLLTHPAAAQPSSAVVDEHEEAEWNVALEHMDTSTPEGAKIFARWVLANRL